MTDTRTAWTEVADHLSALCLKLKLHAEEEFSDDDVQEASGVDRLSAIVDQTVEAIEDAFEDDAVRDDARAVASSFLRAVQTTIRDAEQRVRSGS